MEPLIRPIFTGLRAVEFKYDYMGRRVEKLVYGKASGSAWDDYPTERRRYVWGSSPAGHGWLMLMETIERDTDTTPDGEFDEVRTKRYTWGRDLSSLHSVASVSSVAGPGSCGTGLQPVNCLTGAGGIGGLLAVADDEADPNTPDAISYCYMYDANGNVGQVVDWSKSDAGAIEAKYEYDVYGNVTASDGDYAEANTYRFSTKPWDDETGLGSWGLRYYDPRLGRWINHDPLEEKGAVNLYQFVGNRAGGYIDALGQCIADGQPCDDRPPLLDEDLEFDALESILDAGCFVQCYVLGMTQEDIIEILRELEKDAPAEVKLWIQQILLTSPGRAANALIALMRAIRGDIKLMQGLGYKGKCLKFILDKAGNPALELRKTLEAISKP